MSRTNSFPKAPAIGRIGFPYLQEGLVNAGYIFNLRQKMQYSPHQYIPTLFSFFGRSPSGRKGLILLRLAFHQSFLQAFRTCRKDLVNAAYIFNFGQKMQHISVGTPKSFSFLGGAPFSRRGLIRLRLALHQSFLQYFRTCRKDW